MLRIHRNGHTTSINRTTFRPLCADKRHRARLLELRRGAARTTWSCSIFILFGVSSIPDVFIIERGTGAGRKQSLFIRLTRSQLWSREMFCPLAVLRCKISCHMRGEKEKTLPGSGVVSLVLLLVFMVAPTKPSCSSNTRRTQARRTTLTETVYNTGVRVFDVPEDTHMQTTTKNTFTPACLLSLPRSLLGLNSTKPRDNNPTFSLTPHPERKKWQWVVTSPTSNPSR